MDIAEVENYGWKKKKGLARLDHGNGNHYRVAMLDFNPSSPE
jgi:hypothetical protein